jgi:hypothetical protein
MSPTQHENLRHDEFNIQHLPGVLSQSTVETFKNAIVNHPATTLLISDV